MEAGACVAPSPLLWCTCSLLGLQAVLVRQYESSRGDLTVSMRLDENAGRREAGDKLGDEEEHDYSVCPAWRDLGEMGVSQEPCGAYTGGSGA